MIKTRCTHKMTVDTLKKNEDDKSIRNQFLLFSLLGTSLMLKDPNIYNMKELNRFVLRANEVSLAKEFSTFFSVVHVQYSNLSLIDPLLLMQAYHELDFVGFRTSLSFRPWAANQNRTKRNFHVT